MWQVLEQGNRKFLVTGKTGKTYVVDTILKVRGVHYLHDTCQVVLVLCKEPGVHYSSLFADMRVFVVAADAGPRAVMRSGYVGICTPKTCWTRNGIWGALRRGRRILEGGLFLQS